MSFKDKYNWKVLSNTDEQINDPSMNGSNVSNLENIDDYVLDFNNKNIPKSLKMKMILDSQNNDFITN
jgi:hypothetical protein